MNLSRIIAALPGVAVLSLTLFACGSEAPAPDTSLAEAENAIIYGSDDRLDLYQVSDAVLRRVADSTVIIMDAGLLTPSAGGGYDLDAFAYGTYGEYFWLCTDERFWDQPTPGSCSGFQVGDDLIATAGHCVNTTCGNEAFVFNFAMHTDASTYPTQVGDDDVYYCAEIVAQVQDATNDYAVVRVDRPIVGGFARAPLPIRRDSDGQPEDDPRIAGMVSVSYPSGIPVKVKGGPDPIPNLSIGGVNIQASYASYFEVGADVSAGSSGSVLVSFDTAGDLLFAEAHLVAGNADFRWVGDCYRMVVCNYDTGCTGNRGDGWEEFHRTTTYDEHVPPTDCSSAPGGCQYEVSALGDACWESGDTRAGGVVAFDCGPSAAPRGSLHLQTGVGANPDKATLDRQLWGGGGGCDAPPMGDLLSEVVSLDYTWQVASDGGFSFAAPALKLIIDTIDPNGLDAAKLETVGDKILVYEAYLQYGAMMAEDVWLTESITAGQGLWWLVDLTPGGSTGLGPISRSDLRTLAEWSAAFAAAGLGPATIASIQIGIGSYNAGLDSWVDDFSYSSANTTVHVEFADPAGLCSATAATSSSSVLSSTASFYDRGVGTKAADAYIRVDAADAVGETLDDKTATLRELSDELRQTVRRPRRGRRGRPGSHGNARVLRRRIEALRALADGASGGDPTDDLLTGDAAIAFDRMLDRALEAAAVTARRRPARRH